MMMCRREDDELPPIPLVRRIGMLRNDTNGGGYRIVAVNVIATFSVTLCSFLLALSLWSYYCSHNLMYSYLNEVSYVSCSQIESQTKFSFKNSSPLNHQPNYSIALGIISVERPNAPDYIYAEVMSILDSLFVKQHLIAIDKVHIFDGTFDRSGKQVEFFKYSKYIQVHPMDCCIGKPFVKYQSNQRKASFNYLRAVRYLTTQYPCADAYLILEDDVIFDPDATSILWRTLNQLHLQNSTFFLVDGYNRGPPRTISEESDTSDVLKVFRGERKCCSQAYLLSPKAARMAVPMIENSLNGKEYYAPLDLFLTRALHQQPNFEFYLAKKCWVQHVGFPHLGLGVYHRGCSRMTFANAAHNNNTLRKNTKSQLPVND